VVSKGVLWLSLALFVFAAPALARQDRPTYYQNLSASTFVPGQDVVLSLGSYTTSNDSETAMIYRLPDGRVPENYPQYTSNPVAKVTFTPVASNALRADAGRLRPGYYVFRLDRSDASQTWLFCISSFGLVVTRYDIPAVTWPVDLTTFTTFHGQLNVRVVDGHVTRTLSPNPDGTYEDSAARSRDAYEIATAPDGSQQVVELAAVADYMRDYIEMDRPLYRPGQTVHFRGILRYQSAGAYAIPTGTASTTISTYDGGDRQMYHRSLQISKYGTISGDFQIPLHAPLGWYSITIDANNNRANVAENRFLVEAYKKPEVTLKLNVDKPYAIAGTPVAVKISTQYLFGRPGSGMRITYRVTSQKLWYTPYNPYDGYAVPEDYSFHDAAIAEGELVADRNGRGSIDFIPPPNAMSREIDVRAEAHDTSGRTVAARIGLFDYPSTVEAHAQLDRWFATSGSLSTITVRAADRDGKPLQNQLCELSIAPLKWNASAARFDSGSFDSHQLTTDALGRATYVWNPSKSDLYALDVRSTDRAGRVSYERTYAMVVKPDWDTVAAGPDRLLLVPAKTVVKPKEPLRMLLVSPVAGHDALVTVGDGRLRYAFVVHMNGRSQTFDVMPPADDATFYVDVVLANNRSSSARTRIDVRPPEREMRVSIRPAKPRYKPGDLATLHLWTRSQDGRPLQAEVSLGVADEAIYALHDQIGKPFETFFSYWYFNGGMPSWDLQAQEYANGGIRTIARVSSRSAGIAGKGTSTASSDGVRSDFEDTAYWNASIITDARGRASVSFRWPDDLTTWRAKALGVTTATDIGTASTDILVTKDFLVRLSTPRFLRFGDTTTIVGVAQGTRRDPHVQMRLSVDDAELSVQRRVLDANATASAAWSLNAPASVGNFDLTLRGDDGRRSDAMQSAIPIEPATAPDETHFAGAGSGGFHIGIPTGYQPGSLTVTAAPSIVAMLGAAVRSLRLYPYDCTEQTLSAAIPTLYFDGLLKRSNIKANTSETESLVQAALERLQQLQHRDGSFGWWENDAAHPFMTAYAVYALAQIQKAGYSDDFVLRPAIDSLLHQLDGTNDDTLRFWGGRQPDSEWNTRAYMLFALSQASASSVPVSVVAEAARHADQLNSYAVAVLGLAAHSAGDDSDARKLTGILSQRANESEGFTSWQGQSWHYGWEDDPLETTAYALRLEWTMNPDSPLVKPATAFLIDKIGSGWGMTTKDTAAIVYALSEVLPPQRMELSPDERVGIWVDNKLERTMDIRSTELDAADSQLVIQPQHLHDGSVVRIGRIGTGTLYWSAAFDRYPPIGRVAQTPGVTIERSYRTERTGPWRVGDEVLVDVTVSSNRDLQYVAIEDPFPAGFEPSVDQGTTGDDTWSALRFLDDRATFFLDALTANKPFTFHYALRATNAGTYTAPPTMVSEMYGPDARALGTPARLSVAP
jgi:uncharacterized protein YfaS (alpha-2-macroglobulin family)